MVVSFVLLFCCLSSVNQCAGLLWKDGRVETVETVGRIEEMPMIADVDEEVEGVKGSRTRMAFCRHRYCL